MAREVQIEVNLKDLKDAIKRKLGITPIINQSDDLENFIDTLVNQKDETYDVDVGVISFGENHCVLSLATSTDCPGDRLFKAARDIDKFIRAKPQKKEGKKKCGE
jgi:hypothetical protein